MCVRENACVSGIMSGGQFTHLLTGLWVLWLSQAALVSGSKFWEVPMAPLASSSNQTSLEWEPQCQYRHLQDGVRITADIPPRLEGIWVSTRCEVRPGPEFLTRSYTFYPSRLFKVLQHFYADSGCEEPAYSLVVRGKLRLRQASWITRGATETEHHLHKVGMVVHSPGAIHRLTAQLRPACVDLISAGVVPGRLYELYNVRAGRDCLGVLGFSMMELGLVRVETHHQRHGRLVQELFLGDIHTDPTQRAYYRPTGYQQPLQNAMHHIHPCPTCALVFRASEEHPPVLSHASGSAPLSLEGRWVSQRCEARPAVLFLTREFTFRTEEHSWEGLYRHYSDPSCSRPTFTLRASGHYAQGGPSARVQGGTEFVFKVTGVSVTALDTATARVLNATRGGTCGAAGAWVVGAEQDVTPTNGCTVLGVKLPHKEYELFRTELDHRRRPLLFIGQRPTDGSSADRPQKRPTSYQAAMVHCDQRDAAMSYWHTDRLALAASGATGTPQTPGLVLVPVCLLWGWRCAF